MLISHEVPKQLLGKSLSFNDYDYFLVHLLCDKEYRDFYMTSKELGRKSILDNSAYEFKVRGEASYNFDIFANDVELYKPDEYIIPDEFNDMEKTVENVLKWNKEYKDLPGKSIAVIHGSTPMEMVECYKELVDKVDKIAINCGDDAYNVYKSLDINKSKSLGRSMFINYLLMNNILDENKPHHLLGCYLPQEFKQYRGYKFIETIDTSNPVASGLDLIKYKEYGLDEKPKTVIDSVFNNNISDEQLDTILYNVNTFKDFVNK